MNKIQIVSWLLTRRCNLNCSYCAIVKDYFGKPTLYPNMKYYIQNEMDTKTVIKGLGDFKKHNPDAFHILYGGEPLLRKDLPEIINFCNENNIHYTIITNNTNEIQPLMEKLFENTDYIIGLTSSVDPLVVSDDSDTDRIKKSKEGMDRLVNLKGKVKDLVAEITVDNRNISYLYDLIKTLTGFGINSDITFVDIQKNKFYDFSNVDDEEFLVHPTKEIKDELERIINDKSLDVHMSETLLDEIFKILPANLDCEIENDIHNITVDADGSIRLCLRIRGLLTPGKVRLDNLFDKDYNVNNFVGPFLQFDKRSYCEGCNWTCMLMSKLLSSGQDSTDNLLHSDRRN